MNDYTVLPKCVCKLLKAGDGKNIEIQYLKCTEKMTIEVKDGKVIPINILLNKQSK